MRASLLLALLLATGAFCSELHVSPGGRDDAPGDSHHPLATVGEALERARDDTVRVIHLHPGLYRIRAPLLITTNHTRTADTALVIRGKEGQSLVVGSAALPRPDVRADGLWSFALPAAVLERTSPVRQVFVNGRRAVRAREPDTGYFFFRGVREEAPAKQDETRTYVQHLAVYPEQADLLKAIPEDERTRTEWLAFHKWDNTRKPIDAFNPGTDEIVSSGGIMKSWNPLRTGTRYRLDNFRAALDEPGEWFIEGDHLLYRPRLGEKPNACKAEIPLTDVLLNVQGDPANNRPVEHVHFEGLTLAYAAATLPNNRFEPQQAAASIEAAVLLDGARHVSFKRCTIEHTGLYGIWFREGCRDVLMERCVVRDTGGGGVRIGPMKPWKPEQPLSTSGITVHNNLIYSGGREFPCAVGVWIGHSGHNRVTHNEIGDFFYTGMSAGWNWGYSYSPAKHNEIRFNHVHHIGQGVLSDMGGIYTLGVSEGTSVSDNHFHDIYSYGYGGWGLYTDQASSHILMQNNLVHDVKTGGFHQHFGKDNLIRNNIFAYSSEHQLQATRVEDGRNFVFEHNIVYWDEGPLMSGRWREQKAEIDHNLYWRTGGGFDFQGLDWAAWRAKGFDVHSKAADPMFADPGKRNFTLPADSPALDIGFKPFDPSQAGLVGDQAWRARAEEVPCRDPEPKQLPPPLALHESFEHIAPGKAPGGFILSPSKRKDLFHVTADKAADGQHSLRVMKEHGLPQSWQPHWYLRPNYTNGTARFSCRLLWDNNNQGIIEWRDYTRGNPYAVGPRVRWQGRSLHLPGTPEIRVPEGQWVHLEMEAPLANRVNDWKATVTLPGANRPVFAGRLSHQQPTFSILSWVGFMSVGQQPTSYYLDDVRLSVDE